MTSYMDTQTKLWQTLIYDCLLLTGRTRTTMMMTTMVDLGYEWENMANGKLESEK